MAKARCWAATMVSVALVTVSALPNPAALTRRASAAEPLLSTTSVSAADATAPGGAGASVSPGARTAPRHILVQLHPRASEQQFLREARAHGLRRLGRVPGTRWLTVGIPAGANARQATLTARGLSGVVRATLDPIVAINDQRPPRDPLYANDGDHWGLLEVEAGQGWLVERGRANVVIAILDSGIALGHDDLRAKLWTNPAEIPGNGIDDDGNGIVDDVYGADFVGTNTGAFDDDPTSMDGNPDVPKGGTWQTDPLAVPFGLRFAGDSAVGDGVDNDLDGLIDIGVTHGTLVAGIAAAATDHLNAGPSRHEGMASACRHCGLMPVRVINAEGWAFGSDAASGIYYAANMGAHVVNISWGIDVSGATPELLESLQILVEAIEYAASRGVIVVAAAGNSGMGLHFPASMASAIAVGSSSRHRGVDDAIDPVAPDEPIRGTAVVSAYDALLYDALGLPGIAPGAAAYANDGTSFAAPLVSGYIGLILSQNPGATLKQVRQALRANAVDYSGFGRLRTIVPTLTPESNAPPVASAGGDRVVWINGKATTATVTLDASGSRDTDGTLVSYQWLDDGVPIASGRVVSVNLPLGPHAITLRVTDDDQASAADTVRIDVGRRRGKQ
jgi:subtilisin family serine protease